MEPLVRVERVTKSFLGVAALTDVSLDVPEGRLVGVLGPNGAGKSTLFHVIAGHLRPDAGDVRFAGRSLRRQPPYRRAAQGIGLVFQKPHLFPGMTVLENVMAGQFLCGRSGFVAAALRLPRHREDERAAATAARAALARLGFGGHEDVDVAGLPFGSQRRVALAQALGVGTRLLLLDEPAAGLTGGERDELRHWIGRLRDDGVSVLLVEHDVPFVAALADQLVVLDRGGVLARGAVSRVLADPAVVAAYGGVSG